jgi:exosome complex RNA-binding protein Rrp4
LPENIGVDVILGKNGFIWITRTIPAIWRQQEEAAAGLGSGGIGPGGGGPDDGAGGTPLAETLQHLQHRHNSTPLLLDERVNVTRVRNCIHVLAR